jgi:hypothetical protein
MELSVYSILLNFMMNEFPIPNEMSLLLALLFNFCY